MFGHNALNYANFGSLVLGAEVKTFRASTEVSKDDSSNYYVRKLQQQKNLTGEQC